MRFLYQLIEVSAIFVDTCFHRYFLSDKE